MLDPLLIIPARCSFCGSELPVIGELVTFRCQECSKCWIVGKEGLLPITVYRATTGHERSGEKSASLWLPFWIADIHGPTLRKCIEDMAPPLSLDRVSQRLARSEIFRIFVPAFKSLNAYAYLKIGRLLSNLQPQLTLERSDDREEPILGAITAEEASQLLDFIFLATLGEGKQRSAEFIDHLKLEPVRPLYLVELPFMESGSSLISVLGGFWISGRLVDHGAQGGRINAESCNKRL